MMMMSSLNLNNSPSPASSHTPTPRPLLKASSSLTSSSSVANIVLADNNSPANTLNQPPSQTQNHGPNLTLTNINNNSTSGQPDWFELPKMESFVDLFSIGCSTAVIFGGLVPYIPQYLKIKRSMNSDGFSTYVCLTLLLANILRIMFWFGHRFEMPLLIQSFVMIVGMLAMMEICVRVRDKNSTFTISSITGAAPRRRFLIGGDDGNLSDGTSESMPIYSLPASSSSSSSLALESTSQESRYSSTRTTQEVNISSSYQQLSGGNQPAGASPDSVAFSSSASRSTGREQLGSSLQETVSIRTSAQLGGNKCSRLRNFWDWDDNLSYIKFLCLFTVILGALTYLLLDNYLYVESLGFVAVFTESMLGMPQLFRNHIKKSTRGMSVEMVIMWLSGDLFKTLYFIIRKAPVQFYVCGSIQVIVDVLILAQVLWYRRPNVTYRKLPKSG